MASDKSFRCTIVTPEDTVFEGDVESLVLPGEEGKFGILYNHTPYMAVLETGQIKIEDNDGKTFLACGGGYAEVKDNTVTVLAETAEFPDDIEVSEVKETIQTLTEKLKSEEAITDELERREINDQLERAKVRLKTAESL